MSDASFLTVSIKCQVRFKKNLLTNDNIVLFDKKDNIINIFSFLNQIDVIQTSGFIPTNQDILFCRIKTISISKIDFEIPIPKKYGGGMAEFWMFDVGGQRGERKKWIKVFAGIQAILFLIASSDFDLKLREDESVNRLQESFNLFQDIYSNV